MQGSLPRDSAQLMFVLSVNPGCYRMKYCTTKLKDWLKCIIRGEKKRKKKKNNNFQSSEVVFGTAQRLWFAVTSQTGAFHRTMSLALCWDHKWLKTNTFSEDCFKNFSLQLCWSFSCWSELLRDRSGLTHVHLWNSVSWHTYTVLGSESQQRDNLGDGSIGCRKWRKGKKFPWIKMMFANVLQA